MLNQRILVVIFLDVKFRAYSLIAIFGPLIFVLKPQIKFIVPQLNYPLLTQEMANERNTIRVPDFELGSDEHFRD